MAEPTSRIRRSLDRRAALGLAVACCWLLVAMSPSGCSDSGSAGVPASTGNAATIHGSHLTTLRSLGHLGRLASAPAVTRRYNVLWLPGSGEIGGYLTQDRSCRLSCRARRPGTARRPRLSSPQPQPAPDRECGCIWSPTA